MARSARATGAAVYGPIDQGDFLRALGIDVRARALAERAPERADEFEAGAPTPRRQGRRRNGRAVQGDGGGQPLRAAAAGLPALSDKASVSAAEFLRAEALALPGLAHAFFTRRGGVSTGVYDSLNGGVGSRDAARGRARQSRAHGGGARRSPPIGWPFPIRSIRPTSRRFLRPSRREARPRCDALVTATPGLGLGVTGADCGMILFADPEARVVGGGARRLEGRARRRDRGDGRGDGAARRADPSAIGAALGPCIAQGSYEVGPEFVAAFAAADADSERFFAPSVDPDARDVRPQRLYRRARARAPASAAFEDLGLDTYADEDRFFSYRRATHRKEPDYGRLVAAIALA